MLSSSIYFVLVIVWVQMEYYLALVGGGTLLNALLSSFTSFGKATGLAIAGSTGLGSSPFR